MLPGLTAPFKVLLQLKNKSIKNLNPLFYTIKLAPCNYAEGLVILPFVVFN